MQRHWRRSACIAMALLLGAALWGGSALARDTEDSWEVGVFGSASHYDIASHLTDSLGPGVRVGYHLKATSEIELYGDHADSTSLNLTPDVTFKVTRVGVNFVRNYLRKKSEKMDPLLEFGLGDIKVDNGTDSASNYYLRLGGGLKVFITPRAAIRLDASILRWRGNGDVTPTTAFFTFDGTIGFSYFFGGAAATPAPAPAKP